MLFYRAYEKKTVKQGHGNLIGAPAGQSFFMYLIIALKLQSLVKTLFF